ncbi:NUDIX hydrolase [Sporosarcina sp. ANT_H38]|uniref:NUDIX hydrolase n=1 Tax=Sporosarcina sp. ANT_H38 TaxID=2597358 RepID=UPI0011F25099|nr:NUDIX hydrolase [Sporosarcina sp. ANT_H38]KAA0955793.1 NUDIX hydrolase [Sporosarcina sp. ANT_H38]
MRKGIIRPLVICLFRSGNSILVFEGYDPLKGDHYYRPIGGGIEFGETSIVALKREVKEEIGAEITKPKYLGTIENIFTFNGDIGHEIVMVYDAAFVDTSFYSKASFEGQEDDGTIFKLLWIPLKEFQNGNLRLVPETLLELIQKNI